MIDTLDESQGNSFPLAREGNVIAAAVYLDFFTLERAAARFDLIANRVACSSPANPATGRSSLQFLRRAARSRHITLAQVPP